MVSISVIAVLICSIPRLCSSLAAAISETRLFTCFTASIISLSASPLLLTSSVPFPIFSTESLIRTPISFAASPERCARFRTSPATTANPRPWSPARAASTAALSASRFVWNAISFIMEIISAIRELDALISPIDFTASSTISPPFTASESVLVASLLASIALSEFCFVVAFDSSIVAAISSRDEACSEVL